MDLIELKGITKKYSDGDGPERVVLKDLDLRVAQGEFLAVTGPSGSGKTTLLGIIGSLVPPDAGTCRREGKAGFLFQEPRLLPQLTVLQNILVPALADRESAPPETVEYALELLEFTGIRALADRYPERISGGEASRAALCRALVMRPAVLLADEPTGQLDRENALKIAALLKRVSAGYGTTVVMVTHDPAVAAAADRTFALDNIDG